MADAKAFRIIVATDGSSNARGAVTTARLPVAGRRAGARGRGTTGSPGRKRVGPRSQAHEYHTGPGSDEGAQSRVGQAQRTDVGDQDGVAEGALNRSPVLVAC
jgi:hypothetical protein